MNSKGDTLFPSRGFFNEVTQVKEKFKKTLSQFFPPTQSVRPKVKEIKDKDSRQRQASPR